MHTTEGKCRGIRMDGRGATETMGGNRQRAGSVRKMCGGLLEIVCEGHETTPGLRSKAKGGVGA